MRRTNKELARARRVFRKYCLGQHEIYTLIAHCPNLILRPRNTKKVPG